MGRLFWPLRSGWRRIIDDDRERHRRLPPLNCGHHSSCGRRHQVNWQGRLIGDGRSFRRHHAVSARHQLVALFRCRGHQIFVSQYWRNGVDRVPRLHIVVGRIVGRHAVLSADRHSFPATHNSDVHGVVLPGFPRKIRANIGYD
jgi:hypothetical protein